MKNIYILIYILLICVAGNAYCILLTFEDIPNSTANTYGEFPTSYNGFSFTSNLDWIDTVGSSWNYGSVSGQFTVLNNNSGVGIITAADGSDFSFTSIWARIWGTGTRTGDIQGYKDGSLVWTQSMSISTTWAYLESEHFESIDELRINLGNHFLIDDLTLNETTIPEPSTLLLFLCICSGLFLSKKLRPVHLEF